MIDFTFQLYNSLIEALKNSRYSFFTFNEYLTNNENKKKLVLRHDVDLRPQLSLETAKLENRINIKSTYYFRITASSYDENIIREIADMGHEIGYHYEDLVYAKGNLEIAFSLFCRNLEKLRKLFPVKTICMHGSPLSKWDSRDIWKKYDYKKLGILGEPYFDTDFSKMLYLTDTGRCWNGENVSVRDKPITNGKNSLHRNYKFHNTSQIISSAKMNHLPNEIMITTHPQRWTNNAISWTKEYCMQNIKNTVKYFIVRANQASIV